MRLECVVPCRTNLCQITVVVTVQYVSQQNKEEVSQIRYKTLGSKVRFSCTEPPGAPQRVVVSSGGAETLTVEWDEPEITNEGGITAYNINCTATGSSVSQS